MLCAVEFAQCIYPAPAELLSKKKEERAVLTAITEPIKTFNFTREDPSVWVHQFLQNVLLIITSDNTTVKMEFTAKYFIERGHLDFTKDLVSRILETLLASSLP